MPWTHDDIPDQTGKSVIVTGANSGIGFETARFLARAGAEVVLACRNGDRGQAAIDRITQESPAATVSLESLDLSDLKSVEHFSQRIHRSHQQIDLLINNAGIMTPPLSHTVDGFELQFGTNHLGHFALTGGLFDLLCASSQARIVTVASLAHRWARIHFDDLNSERSYKRMSRYGQSKLANLLFTHDLQRRIDRAGLPMLAVACHPGWTATNLQRTIPGGLMFNWLLAQSAANGALPTLYAAVADDVGGNAYIGPRGWFEATGPPEPAYRTPASMDDADAERLWRISEELTNVAYP